MDINALLNTLTPAEQKELKSLLREENVLFVSNMDELVAAIKQIEERLDEREGSEDQPHVVDAVAAQIERSGT